MYIQKFHSNILLKKKHIKFWFVDDSSTLCYHQCRNTGRRDFFEKKAKITRAEFYATFNNLILFVWIDYNLIYMWFFFLYLFTVCVCVCYFKQRDMMIFFYSSIFMIVDEILFLYVTHSYSKSNLFFFLLIFRLDFKRLLD